MVLWITCGFVFEARKANAVLRLYEAATALGGPDAEGNTFCSGYGFKFLLGAMYLQTIWFVSATGEFRRCQRPGCNKIFTSGRKDKRFCSDNCRVKNHQRLHKAS